MAEPNKSPLDIIWRWGFTARVAALCVFASFFLPWCGSIKGTELLRADGLERFWFFPGAAAFLLLLPFLGRRHIRFVLETLTALGLAIGAAAVAMRFRQLRGPGVELALGAGIFGFLGACWGWWHARRAKPQTLPPDPSDDPST